MEGFDKKDELQEGDSKFREEIFSKAVRAGKRTYFFDVKATRKDEYYLTITESKKRYDQDGKFHFEKHKIFLYKEDFEKFSDGLGEVIDFIRASQSMEDAEIDVDMTIVEDEEEVIVAKDYTNVEFDDLNS
ncbi:DUF3276 family protein [Sunxiuqinia sp. sy24]|uniref:DUF3276 family protein n=1 Tax=Sunxiuqinia sp. sy24 TaxID=3461495 RepID=UPI004045E409